MTCTPGATFLEYTCECNDGYELAEDGRSCEGKIGGVEIVKKGEKLDFLEL